MIDSAIFGSDIVEVDSLYNAIYPSLTAGLEWVIRSELTV
jgi:hypothetical protein